MQVVAVHFGMLMALLFLQDLLKCVEGSQGRRELQEAVDTMLTVLKCLNDSMHQVAIVGFPVSVPPCRTLGIRTLISVLFSMINVRWNSW